MSKPEKKGSKSSVSGSANKKGSWPFFLTAVVIIILVAMGLKKCSNDAFNNDVRERAKYESMAPQREAAEQKMQVKKERMMREDLPA